MAGEDEAFQRDIVHYTVTLLVETSNILSCLVSEATNGLDTVLHLIDKSAALNLGSKTFSPDLTVVVVVCT